MKGRRVPWPEGVDAYEILESLEPGDYAGRLETWLTRSPNGVIGEISKHTIVEHPDGTITVSPSILFYKNSDGTSGWHGFLEAGVWREA